MRKTIQVEDLRKTVNDMLKAETSKEERMGMITVLESVLHSTGNYNGFKYLDKREVPNGHRPGIRGYDGTYEENFRDTDDSRRFYF